MEYIMTAAEMKKCDENTTNIYGIDASILMERAALETVRVIVERYGTDCYVGIAAGSGNNAGDGVAIARILHEYGVHAEINLIADPQKASPLLKQQLAIADKIGIPIHFGMEHYQYDVIVDALLGIGITRPVEGVYREVIEGIKDSKAKVVAVDIPSGIHTDSACVMGCAVKADITVTYAYKKLGLILYPGAQYAGEVICVPIGIPRKTAGDRKSSVITFVRRDLRLPERSPSGNKGSFGKVLLIAGSRNMGGACQLAALSAFRIGAGMVRIFTAEENRDSLLRKVPEAMVHTYQDDEKPELTPAQRQDLSQALAWADVVAMGPGMSTSAKAGSILEQVFAENTKPLVLDADALNLLSQKRELLQSLEHGRKGSSYEVIMTPHLGELARLVQHPIPELKKDLIAAGTNFAKKYDVTLVCKDARTLITKRFKPVYLNTSGNDGMATAGSGDVLTGIIAGLAAQGYPAYQAATMGTYIHGLAGDLAKAASSSYYIMAQDIIQALKQI